MVECSAPILTPHNIVAVIDVYNEYEDCTHSGRLYLSCPAYGRALSHAAICLSVCMSVPFPWLNNGAL